MPPVQSPNDIRLNEQNELEAIIGNPPGWTLRWGLLVLLLGLALLAVIAWFVSYPDVVQARAVLTTERPPIRLAANQSAKISQLLVKNGQAVEAGEMLAVLENPASWVDVEQLDSFVDSLNRAANNDWLTVNPPENLQLGSLQATFSAFSQSLKDLQFFLKQDLNFLKISNLQRQMSEIQTLNRSLKKQVGTLAQEVNIARQKVERERPFADGQTITRLEFEETQAHLLRLERQLEALASDTLQNRLRLRQMEGQILDLQQVQSDNNNERELAFRSDLQRLTAEIDAWKQTWLLTAPVAGEVALTRAWSEQQFVKAGEEVLTIVPQAGAGRIVGKALLTSIGSGKVKVGMPVHLRLDDFPYTEFGTLDGKVERIAAVPVAVSPSGAGGGGGQGYEVEISVPENLTTSHGKTVPFRQEMQGTARIVTEKRSLLKRVMEKIWAAFEE
ncbi:MAG: HlyD family efflux transporter periplasmic adaptor subunit [Bacteroidota bacterium]